LSGNATGDRNTKHRNTRTEYPLAQKIFIQNLLQLQNKHSGSVNLV
jgi:hypothetical protein